MLKKFQIILCSIMLVAATIVVVLGAYTRLVDAGLGCPDWPTCYGHLWVPNSSDEIVKANERFEDTPVEVHKTWPEQIHRIFASSLGTFILLFFALALIEQKNCKGTKKLNSITFFLALLVGATVARIKFGHSVEGFVWLAVVIYFVNVVRCWVFKPEYSRFFILVSLLSGLVILQGLFGMWTVTLKLWPQVVTAHLLGGFATIALIALLWTSLVFADFKLAFHNIQVTPWVVMLCVGACVVVFIQIALGGWTTSNYAALACPDVPMCQEQWLPTVDFKSGFNLLQSVGPNYLGGQLDNEARIAIHLMHRVGALITTIVVSVLAGFFMFNGTWHTRVYGGVLGGVLFAQVLLGISNVFFSLPLVVAVVHNAVGACLLILTFIAACRICDSIARE